MTWRDRVVGRANGEYTTPETEDAAESQGPLITNEESYALYLGARALAEVANGLMRSGHVALAGESARSAEALDGLQRRATIAASRERDAEQEAER